MKLSQRVYDECDFAEGFRANAYLDKLARVPVWTIGYGTTHYPNGNAVKEGDKCDQSSGAQWRNTILDSLCVSIQHATAVEFSQGEIDSFTDFSYEFGLGALMGSTLWKMFIWGKENEPLNPEAHEMSMASQFDLWVFAGGVVLPGMVKRRAVEKGWFLNG